MRVVVPVCTFFGLLCFLQAPCQCDAAQAPGSGAALPTISAPARGDTVRSVWITVRGAVPAELMSGLREIEIHVNNAVRVKTALRSNTFRVADVRLDCGGAATWNAIKAVCLGPSQRVESVDVKVVLAPGPLEIDPYLSTDAICPARPGSPKSTNNAVQLRFAFTTPADWFFRLTGGGGAPILSQSGKGDPESKFTWDGTDEAGALVEDGEYIYEITATSICGDAGQATCCGVIAVDSSVPGRPQLAGPVNDDIVSPDFQLRWQPVDDAWFYEVQLSGVESFDPYEVSSTGASHLRLAKRPDGVFYWRVRAVSRGGTPGPFSEARRTEVRKVMKPALTHLGVVTRSDGLKPERGEAMRVTYMANDDIVISIRIVTADGSLVRTLLDGVARDKGAHVELWDGRGEDGELVPAGAYIAAIEADGTEDVTPFSVSRLVTIVY